jgi:SAM-dependent methyltransferase
MEGRSADDPAMSTSIAAKTAQSPDRILDIGCAFCKSKVLLSAVELGLFTELGGDSLDLATLTKRLGLHERGARDFFDALVALKLLERDANGRYFNRPDCALYLDRRSPSYLGGKLEFLNARLYPIWGRLTKALRTGEPQTELGTAGYASLYADPLALEEFLQGMSGGSLLPARELARIFAWKSYRTVIDIGTAQGRVPVEIARAHAHLGGGGFDLPQVEPVFMSFVREHGMEQRLRFYPGDFLKEELPRADVLIMGRILHNWNLPTKLMLVQKAHRALSPGGVLIVYDKLIDDERRNEAQALLASLNMLIETAGGFDYTAAQCIGWMRDCGFADICVEPLDGGESAVIGLKPGQ